jgi:NET1-associated nuclear protein 1 (U3 small nucleolar RNA-associated protein 17)
MASILKRKRGSAEVMDTPKRSKSVKNGKVAEMLASTPASGWDVAFPASKSHELVENGVNGDDGTEALDFETVIDSQHQATEELTRKRAQQHEEAQRALKKAIRRREQQAWKLSEATGGRMIDVDPVFTSGEKYELRSTTKKSTNSCRFLIVANRTTVHVYSTSNSLLHRSIKLKLETRARIITYYLSPTYENILWVAASDGSIFSLDWTTGAGAEQYWGISSTGCTHMTVASMESGGRRRDVVFTSEPRKGGGWRITANELAPPNGPVKTAARTIYTSSHRINFLSSVCEGSVIVASADNSVLVGNLRATDFDTVDKMRYEFRVFESAEAITCLDVKAVERTDPKEFKKTVAKLPVVNVAVGGAKGAIFYHNDLLAKLVMSQHGTLPAGVSLLPKKLHWHRKAVHTVKFSLDGNCSRISTKGDMLTIIR